VGTAPGKKNFGSFPGGDFFCVLVSIFSRSACDLSIFSTVTNLFCLASQIRIVAVRAPPADFLNSILAAFSV